MKILKPFILVSLMLLAGGKASACGPWYYNAEDNDIYRILPYGKEGPALPLTPDFCRKNIMLWSQQTGCPDTAAIRRAIYKGTLADWEALYRNGKNTSKSWFASNAFVKQLLRRRDNDAIRILYLSKQYESIREAMNSPWYYSGSETNEMRQLKALYTTVSQQLGNKGRYADRYRFLAMKCSWALEDDNTTLALWNQMKPQLKNSIFLSECEDYAARCLYRTGRTDEAYQIYLQRGDIGSLMMLKETDLPQLLELVLRIAPDSPTIPVELQRMLFTLENNPYALENKICMYGYGNHRAVLPIAQRAAKETILDRRAMWCYTAACLLDYDHRPLEALRQLEGIDNLPCDPFLKRSIRVLRFYLHCKTDKVNDTFEQYALEELQWLDKELEKEWRQLPQRERHKLSHLCSTDAESMFRSCYAYDAMRRILLPDSVGLCYRLAFNGREIRALQIANMAENRLFILANNQVMAHMRKRDQSKEYKWRFDESEEYPGFVNTWHSWPDPDTTGSNGWTYRLSWNTHDYCNWMFLLVDRMDAKTLEAYRERQLHPRDDIDRWLYERGYNDSDYWEDIIGTHHLRECDYTAAVQHLKLVSPQYQQRMNISCEQDPFGWVDKLPNDDLTGYKLHFAERMVLLKAMMESGDPDSRGAAMLEYAIGMRNSFDRCWYLTTYGKSSIEFEDGTNWKRLGYYGADPKEVSWSVSPLARLTGIHYGYKRKALIAADMLQKKAFYTFVSDEARAKGYARLGMIDKVVKNYTRTATAQHYALVCDEWRMYRM